MCDVLLGIFDWICIFQQSLSESLLLSNNLAFAVDKMPDADMLGKPFFSIKKNNLHKSFEGSLLYDSVSMS